MKVKEESEKVGLKLNIQKTKIMGSGTINSWGIDGETVETVSKQRKQCIFLGSKITADGDCSRETKRCLLLGRKVMTNPDSVLKRNINPNSKELKKFTLTVVVLFFLLFIYFILFYFICRCRLSTAKILARVTFEKMFSFDSHIFRDNCHCFSVAQSCSTLRSPCTAAHQASLSFTIS